MRLPPRALLLALALALAGCGPSPAAAPPAGAPQPALLPAPASPAATSAAPSPPVARKEPKVDRIHGYERVDEYAWMRNKDSPEVLAHLAAENAYTEAFMKPTEALRESLYKELLGRIKQTDLSVPYKEGEHFYYSRTEEGKQYPTLCRKRGSLDAPEQVLLDLNEIGKTEKFVGLIARKAYPTMLVKTSYNDSQVMYWEPAKYVARLRAMKTDKNPLLFKINMGPAGHGGFSGRYDRLRDVAFDQAFILTQLGAAR